MSPRPSSRSALLALAALAALPAGAAGAPYLAGTPQAVGVRVADVDRGPAAGTVSLDVAVRQSRLAGRARGRLDATALVHRGLVRVSVLAPGGRVLATAGARRPLLLRAARVQRYRLTLAGAAAARVRQAAGAAERPLRVRVVAQSRLLEDGRRRPREVTGSRRVMRLPHARAWGTAAAAPARPRCESPRTAATAGRRTLIAVRCTGGSPRIALVGGPRRGSVRLVSTASGRALLSYRAPQATGSDMIVLRAANAAGAVTVRQRIAVRPFTMRALGDSVTAGFGYIGDGTANAVPMAFTQLPSCIPPTRLNDRCSSNSANGPGSGGPASWSADFGLSNDVAWPAQFANAHGIGASAFENRAVSGSTPADWGAGGALNDTLAGIVADDPDLTVFTLGANPLLDTFLAGSGIGCAITLSEAAFRACVQRYVDDQQVTERVGAVIDQLLVAPGNRVVVSQYHLVIPSATIFGVTSLRIMSQELNAAVAAAVQASPEAGERVFLMAPPLFPVGLGPGDAICPTGGQSTAVDGQSRQSEPTQDELTVLDPLSFCGSTVYWIISGDTGIHPSRLGHAQFAQALGTVVDANGLMP